MARKTQNSRKISRKTTQEKLHEKDIALAVITQMLTLATSGFGLVAALAWNSLIQEVVNSYVKKFLPSGSGLTSLLIYALVVTILAVVVTMNLAKVKEQLER